MNHPEIIIVPAIFIALVAMVKIISDARVKRMLIEKGKVDENVKFLNAQNKLFSPLNSVKWGLVLIGVGAALLLGQIFPYTFDDVGIMGLMCLFGGVGFLVYYNMVKDKSEEEL